MKHWASRAAPPVPGFAAVTAQCLPFTVPEAISPAGACGPAGCTRHAGVPDLGESRRGGLLVQQDRDGDAGRHDRQSRRRHEAPPAPDHPALPDRPCYRRLAGRDRLERSVEPSHQVFLVADLHCRPPSTSSVLWRSAARARDAWLLTVPTEQPRVTATSVSVSPTQ